MVSVEYHGDLKEVQSGASHQDRRLARLLSDAEQHAPFDRLDWWRLLAGHCGLQPVLAVAHEGDDCVVLALATSGASTGALAGRHLTQLSNWYTFRFRPIVSPGANAAALLTALARDLRHQTQRVTLTGLPEDDADLLARSFRRAGWLAFREQSDVNHVLRLAGRDYAAFLAGRPGKVRTTLKRKAGKVTTRVLTHFDPPAWDAYEAIYAESWKPEEGSPAFLRAFAQAEGTAGRLRLAVAYDPEGQALAAQMWTVEGGTAFIHKLAHRESARPLSPGSVLSAALFRHVIDVDGVQMIDFGTGDDSYKRDWMEEVRPRYRLEAFRLGAPANWPRLARRAVAFLAAPALAARAKRG